MKNSITIGFPQERDKNEKNLQNKMVPQPAAGFNPDYVNLRLQL